MGKRHLEKPEATNRKISSNANSKQIVVNANEHPEWLPNGWNVEFRTRKSGAHMGAEYKCYIDPLNGYKFYSKPEVLRYLDTIKGNCSSEKGKRCNAMNSPSNVAVEKSTANDLPPGWIKEVKIRKNSNGIRKDPYYTDPVSGYIFRSKKDALRYLESGDINTCVFKPNKRQIQDDDKFTPSSTAKRHKLKQSATKRQLFAGEEISEKSSIELSDAHGSQKQHDMKGSAEIVVAPVRPAETVAKMPLLEDAAANPLGKKKSDPADVHKKNYVLNVMETADEKKHSSPRISKNKKGISKNKKGLNLPHRFSKRLAGNKPDQVTDNMINEQALEVPKRSLRKSRTTLDVDLENKLSQQINVVPEIEDVHTNPGDLPHKSSKLSEKQGDFRKQPHQLETEKMEDNRPEPHHCSLFQDSSSSSLKGAIKTTGEIGKIGAQENKSSNKKNHRSPCRASKRLAGVEPEITNSINSEKAPEYKCRKSKGEINGELWQSKGMPAKELADHASTYINAPRNEESSNRGRSYPKIPPMTNEPLEKLGDEHVDDEKSQPQISFAFHYSWSDPCLEFAIKTLTGVLPVEDSVDNGPALVAETEVCQKNKFFKSVTEGSSDKNPQVTSKKSKVKDSVDNGPALVAETDVFQKNKFSMNVTEGSSDKDPQAASNKSTAEDSVDNGPALVAETDVFRKNKFSKSVTEGSNDKNPQVSSKKSTVEDSVDNGPALVAETDVFQKNKFSKSITEGSRDKSPQVTSKKSKKKEFTLPRRLSKRLAGHEPEVVPAERALEYAIRKSCRDEPTATAILSNGASKHLDDGKETELPLHASDCSKGTVHGELSNKSEKSYEAQIVPSEQLQKLEAEKTDERSEPQQLSLPCGNSWSDPCLEFAIKTLTGVLPVDAAADILPVMTSDDNGPPNKELLASVKKCVNEEAHGNLNQSHNEEDIEKVCQPSKQLPGQPELTISSTSCENASKLASRECNGEEANLTWNLDEGKSLNIGAMDMVCQPSKQLLRQPELQTRSTSSENSPKFATRESSGDGANVTRNLDEGESLHIGAIGMVCQPSKQLQGQPELRTSTASCENSPKFATRESYNDEANATRNLNGGESLHIGAIHMVCQPSKQLQVQPELQTRSTSCENSPKLANGGSCSNEANITRNLDEGESLNIGAIDMVCQTSEQLLGQPELRTSSTSHENSPKCATGGSYGNEANITRNLDGESLNIGAIDMVCQTSEQLLGQPELRTSSTSHENSPKLATGGSYGNEANITRNLDEGESLNIGAIDMVCQTSEQLLGQPELQTSSTTRENSPKCATRESYGDEANVTRNLDAGKSLHIESIDMVCQPSKLLLGQPELRISSTSHENSPKLATGGSYGNEGIITRNFDEGESLNIGAIDMVCQTSEQLLGQPELRTSSASRENSTKCATGGSYGDEANVTRNLDAEKSLHIESIDMVCLTSEQLLGQPEVQASTTSRENSPKCATRESYGDEANVTRNLYEGKSLHVESIDMVCQPSKLLLGQPELQNSSASRENSAKLATGESYGDEANTTRNLYGESLHIETIDMVGQPSKQLLGQPGLKTSSISSEKFPEFATRASYGDEANITRNLYGEALHIGAIDMVFQPSESDQLLGQSKLRINAAACENTSKFTTRESYGHEGNITRNFDAESLHIEAGNRELGHQSSNIDTLKPEEPSNKFGQVLEGESAPAEQPHLESQTKNHEKSESQFCAPLMDSWSDPCLEFAFKTLTGAIPVEENLAIQGYFQEPENFRSQSDGGSMWPDFGSPSFSQSDISSHYNVEKSMPGQQSSTSPPFVPPENVNLHCCAGLDSQKRYSQCNKNFQGR